MKIQFLLVFQDTCEITKEKNEILKNINPISQIPKNHFNEILAKDKINGNKIE